MNSRSRRAQRLEQVARLYYEDNKTQEAIASIMEISRPLVSRMLNEARKLGIVEIKIHSSDQSGSLLVNQLKRHFDIKDGIILPDTGSNHIVNRSLANATMQLIEKMGGGRIGIGWGHIIGTLVDVIEESAPDKNFISDISPLVGNFSVTIRNYHSNENVRIIAHQTKATPHYLYSPAFAETQQELELLLQTEHYRTVYREWERLDAAIVNIGNYPSTPDFATVARYGDLLTKHKAVGRLVAHYFSEDGTIIHSDSDYAIQIPIPLLEKCNKTIGVCSANLGSKALIGALKTGLFTHIIAGESLVRDVLNKI